MVSLHSNLLHFYILIKPILFVNHFIFFILRRYFKLFLLAIYSNLNFHHHRFLNSENQILFVNFINLLDILLDHLGLQL